MRGQWLNDAGKQEVSTPRAALPTMVRAFLYIAERVQHVFLLNWRPRGEPAVANIHNYGGIQHNNSPLNVIAESSRHVLYMHINSFLLFFPSLFVLSGDIYE